MSRAGLLAQRASASMVRPRLDLRPLLRVPAGQHRLDISPAHHATTSTLPPRLRRLALPLSHVIVVPQPTLNAFMAKGRAAWRDARERLQALLASPEYPDANPALRSDAGLQARALLPRTAVAMELPAAIGDYTDFYSSRDHAYNVGVMFRGPANALQPNWCVVCWSGACTVLILRQLCHHSCTSSSFDGDHRTTVCNQHLPSAAVIHALTRRIALACHAGCICQWGTTADRRRWCQVAQISGARAASCRQTTRILPKAACTAHPSKWTSSWRLPLLSGPGTRWASPSTFAPLTTTSLALC